MKLSPTSFNLAPCRTAGLLPERKGAAAVEFAVIAPLFLLLLGGIIEFGQCFRIEHALANAARRGARAASLQGATSSQVMAKARADFVAAMNVNAADVMVVVALNSQVGIDLTNAKEGDEIKVTVSIPFSRAGVGFYAQTFAKSTLKATCTIERE